MDHSGGDASDSEAGKDAGGNCRDAATFVPPSIHLEALLSGYSYAHYAPIPEQVSVRKDDEGVEGTECVIGIDEAGRGPVIGPMVYSAFFLPSGLHHTLLANTHHFDDSKVLTAAVRADLMQSLCRPNSDLHKSCGWAVKSLNARDIGAGMLRNGGSYNLNAQAMDATVELIKGVLEMGVNVTETYIDTIGNPAAYQKKLERIFPTIKIVVEKKADSLYPCVSAASVVAKVTRDISCEMLFADWAKSNEVVTASEDKTWGSGYPSDARCVIWLKSHMDSLFGWGNECRFSWGTVKEILDQKELAAIKVDWPSETGDDDEDVNNMRVSDYFSSAPGSKNSTADTEADQLRDWYGTSVETKIF